MLVFAGYQIQNMTSVIIVHFMCGMASGCLFLTCLVINIELLPKAVNPISGIFFVMFYCLRMLVIALSAWIKDHYIKDDKNNF